MVSDSPAIYPSLKGRTAFITGGGSGIGASLVEAFCQQGAQVCFVDVLAKEALALCDKIEGETDARPMFIECDLRDITALQAAIERSEEHTSELQSRGHLVCRLLLEKKKSK